MIRQGWRRNSLKQVYEIDFFDKDLAQRLYWTEATSEREALNNLRKEYTVNTIKSVTISKYTLQEIEDAI